MKLFKKYIRFEWNILKVVSKTIRFKKILTFIFFFIWADFSDHFEI